jgi:signal transduction histidine kinase
MERELGRRAEELAETDRRKNEFLAVLAHELRNPMAPILAGTEVMRRIGIDDPRVVEIRDLLERQVHQLARLVDDLMDVARISHGKVALQKTTIDLATAVTSGVEASRPLIKGRRHEFTVSLPVAPILLEADPLRLAQVFANLLNNAAKYTRPGGTITLTAAREADQAVVRVRDSGIGIPPEMRDRLFDMFRQGETRGSEGGLGIGLALARGLVELHAGTLEVFSEGVGKGSEFVVRLPLPLPLPCETSRDMPAPS